MRADPELAAAWTPAQLGSVLVHHVCHLLRTHGERAQGLGVGPGRGAHLGPRRRRRDQRRPGARRARPARPAGAPPRPGAPDGLLAEQYFEGIAAATRHGAGGRRGEPGPFGANGGKRREAGLTAEAARTGCPGRATARAGCPAGRPNCCGGRSRRTSSRTASRPGPCRPGCCAGRRRSSPRRSTGAPCSRPSCAGPSPRSPGRSTTPTGGRPAGRPWPGDVVLPALRRPVPEVAVVCDTSGSMSEDLLAMALAEVEGLLRAAGAGPAGPRAGLRHRGRARPAGQLRPPGPADRRRRDRHGRGHRGGGRAAAPARRHGGADRRVHAVAGPAPKGTRVVVGLLGARRRRTRRRGPGRSGSNRTEPRVCLAAAGSDLLAGDEHQARAAAGHDADRGRAHLRLRRGGRGQLHPAGRRLHAAS